LNDDDDESIGEAWKVTVVAVAAAARVESAFWGWG